MENEYYNITFAHEAESIIERAIEPSNFWHSLQIPLKTLDDALQLINDLDNYAVKFSRFWEIQKCNSKTFREEVAERSEALKQYLEKEELTRVAFEQDRYNKVEEINKLDKKIVVNPDFHGYSIIIERGDASFNPKVSNSIKCFIAIKFICNANNISHSFFKEDYKSGNRLLKSRFLKRYEDAFKDATKEEMIGLLETIIAEIEKLERKINKY